MSASRTLSTVSNAPFAQKAIVLGVVGVGITTLVYGAVALIVKADDAGLALAERPGTVLPAIGRGVVKAMPGVLAGLTVIGMVAMLMVGGGIVLHGLEELGLSAPAHLVHDVAHMFASIPVVGRALEWSVAATLNTVVGFAIGLALIPVVSQALLPAAGWIAQLRAK